MDESELVTAISWTTEAASASDRYDWMWLIQDISSADRHCSTDIHQPPALSYCTDRTFTQLHYWRPEESEETLLFSKRGQTSCVPHWLFSDERRDKHITSAHLINTRSAGSSQSEDDQQHSSKWLFDRISAQIYRPDSCLRTKLKTTSRITHENWNNRLWPGQLQNNTHIQMWRKSEHSGK